MFTSHRKTWAFGILCLVMFVLNVATEDWGWAVAMGAFVVASALTLYRYYMWPRGIRRP